MAQHIPIDNFKQVAIKNIARSFRARRTFKGSLLFEELPTEHQETPMDRVYVCERAVPSSIVAGGRATFEVHTEPNGMFWQKTTNIYLVA